MTELSDIVRELTQQREHEAAVRLARQEAAAAEAAERARQKAEQEAEQARRKEETDTARKREGIEAGRRIAAVLNLKGILEEIKTEWGAMEASLIVKTMRMRNTRPL